MELIAQTTYSRHARRSRRPTGAEISAWRAFLKAHAATTKALEGRLAGAGLSLPEYDVLLNIGTGPRDGIRPTELAEVVLITKSGLTRLLDRLVAHGYVERSACPVDRRGNQVLLTPAGRRALKRAAPAVLRGIATFFATALGGREIDAFAQSCARVAAAAESMAAEA